MSRSIARVAEALDELVQPFDLDHHDRGRAAVALDAGILVRHEPGERYGQQEAGEGIGVGPGAWRRLDHARQPRRAEAGGPVHGSRGRSDRRRTAAAWRRRRGGEDERRDDEDDVRDDDDDEGWEKDFLRIHGPDDS